MPAVPSGGAAVGEPEMGAEESAAAGLPSRRAMRSSARCLRFHAQVAEAHVEQLLVAVVGPGKSRVFGAGTLVDGLTPLNPCIYPEQPTCTKYSSVAAVALPDRLSVLNSKAQRLGLRFDDGRLEVEDPIFDRFQGCRWGGQPRIGGPRTGMDGQVCGVLGCHREYGPQVGANEGLASS
jgi:hypothetical protein